MLAQLLAAWVETDLKAHPLGSRSQSEEHFTMVKPNFQPTELFKVNKMQTDMTLRLFSHRCSTCFKRLTVLNNIVVQSVVVVTSEE